MFFHSLTLNILSTITIATSRLLFASIWRPWATCWLWQRMLIMITIFDWWSDVGKQGTARADLLDTIVSPGEYNVVSMANPRLQFAHYVTIRHEDSCELISYITTNNRIQLYCADGLCYGRKTNSLAWPEYFLEILVLRAFRCLCSISDGFDSVSLLQICTSNHIVSNCDANKCRRYFGLGEAK